MSRRTEILIGTGILCFYGLLLAIGACLIIFLDIVLFLLAINNPRDRVTISMMEREAPFCMLITFFLDVLRLPTAVMLIASSLAVYREWRYARAFMFFSLIVDLAVFITVKFYWTIFFIPALGVSLGLNSYEIGDKMVGSFFLGIIVMAFWFVMCGPVVFLLTTDENDERFLVRKILNEIVHKLRIWLARHEAT